MKSKQQSVILLTLISVLLVSSANRNVTEDIANGDNTESNEEVSESEENAVVNYNDKESNLVCSDQAIDPAICPSEVECDKLGNECLNCTCDINCQFGNKEALAVCSVPEDLDCNGSRTFQRKFKCSFCYQSDDQFLQCNEKFDCESVANPQDRSYVANCSVPSSLLCFGRRSFSKQRACNWTGGHRWLTTLILSITLGGFGADRYFGIIERQHFFKPFPFRFYLGHWQEGIGKLFSFGGLGVWTLVDVVMIGIRYIGPADGSLYI